MEKGSIIFGFLLPADQNASKAVHPAMSSLHDPTSCSKSSFFLQRLSLLPPRSSMGCTSKLQQSIPYFRIIVALRQAHPLWFRLVWPRTVDHDFLNRFPNQFHAVPVGSFNCQSDRYAVSFGQQTALCSFFSPVHGVASTLLSP